MTDMKRTSRMFSVALSALLLACGCATAQPAPASQPAPPSDVPHVPASGPTDPTIDRILDAMHRRGENLRTLTASVKLGETDAALGFETSRSGKFWLENRPDGSTRAHILFTRKDDGNRAKVEKLEYLLDGGRLVDRNYERKKQVTRVVLRPGEKMNLLKLGEGPFPLPIGQRREDVLANFDVKMIAAKPGDPSDTTHVQLTPKSATSLARKFKTIDVWVNAEDGLPKRIETLDRNESTIRTTDLSDVQINANVTDADFQLEAIDDKWDLIEEAYQDEAGR